MSAEVNPDELLEELAEARDRWWLFSLIFNLLCAASGSAIVLIAIVFADWRWHCSVPQLQVAFSAWCVVSMALSVLALTRAWSRTRNLAATARRLEMSFPELGSDAINLVQLAELDSPDSFQHAALTDAASRLADFPFQAAPYRYAFYQRWKLAMQTGGDVFNIVSGLLVGLALVILIYFFVPNWSQSFDRVMRPWHAEPTERSVDAEVLGQKAS